MPRYNTRQRDVLLQYLSDHAHEALTAHEIALALEDQGISRSAVYRNLSTLVKEGVLKKGAKEDGREAVYQYIDADHCHGKLHLTCKTCGKTIHLPEPETERLMAFLEKEEAFSLAPSDTVLYGECKNCKS